MRQCLILALALLAPVQPAAAIEPPLALCVDADDAPFSSADTPRRGIHVEVAEALAQQMQRLPSLVWVQVPNRGGLGKALRQTLAAGRCDAWLGIPEGPDMARELAERALVASPAYLQLGYVLVAAPGRPVPDAAALRAARKIGAATATPADLYLHRMGLPRAPYAGSAALVEALRAGEIDLALVWSPALAAPAAQDLVRAALPLADDDLYTGLTVATRRTDPATGAALADALRALHAAGRIDAIAARHGLPRVARP